MLITAPASGAGKTTVALAIMAAARRRGLAVQPFKVGPDFIDPGHHARVAGRAARTLDGWMLGAATCRASFVAATARADVAIIEGMMGLFDGVSAAGEAGSSAEIAKWLDVPVVLVVDAGAMARSAAAVVRGFRDFDPAVRIAGVVFNRVGGSGHTELLRAALAGAGLPPCLGGLPSDAALALPERHLGLVTAAEAGIAVDVLADAAERWLEMDAVFALARCSPHAEVACAGGGNGEQGVRARSSLAPSGRAPVTIAVARDEAFSFYYPENLELLAAAGATIVEWSPLRDARLPAGVAGVYLGGGYPEVYAARLARNATMLADLRAFAEDGGLVYAECGGLMLLGDALEDEAGVSHAMAGVLPLRTRMLPRAMTLGYREVTVAVPFLPALTARGHEFHHSTLVAGATPRQTRAPQPLGPAYVVRDPVSGARSSEGFAWRRTLASYVHVHFASAPALAAALVEAARSSLLGKG